MMQRERMNARLRRARLGASISLTLLILFGGIAWTAQQTPRYMVSQKGRAFHPGTLTVSRGDTVQIVNDDGDLLHHAYVESDTFNFDSGDQLPGSKTNIIFSVPGRFNVLCGIHPKMKLVVEVK
jgi:plastocyanin